MSYKPLNHVVAAGLRMIFRRSLNRNVVPTKLLDIQKQLLATPLDANLHRDLAVVAFSLGRYDLAFAEAKTASMLGVTTSIDSILNRVQEVAPPLQQLNHNLHFRFSCLKSAIEQLATTNNCSVLDVGGGDGQLARFLPEEMGYCIAEPDVNGIDGAALPFDDESFDIVVSCHVLEHIPEAERAVFLEQLLSKAKLGVILLNPFTIKGMDETERLDLLIDITDANWAKEHRECTLPDVKLIEKFASERNLACDVKPTGTLMTSMALVFMSHFANASPNQHEQTRIHEFLNRFKEEVFHSNRFPTALQITLRK